MTIAMKYWAEWYIRVHYEKENNTEPNIYYLLTWETVPEFVI